MGWKVIFLSLPQKPLHDAHHRKWEAVPSLEEQDTALCSMSWDLCPGYDLFCMSLVAKLGDMLVQEVSKSLCSSTVDNLQMYTAI